SELVDQLPLPTMKQVALDPKRVVADAPGAPVVRQLPVSARQRCERAFQDARLLEPEGVDVPEVLGPHALALVGDPALDIVGQRDVRVRVPLSQVLRCLQTAPKQWL